MLTGVFSFLFCFFFLISNLEIYDGFTAFFWQQKMLSVGWISRWCPKALRWWAAVPALCIPHLAAVAQPWRSIPRTQTPAGHFPPTIADFPGPFSTLDQGEHEMRLLGIFAEQAPAPLQSGPAWGHRNPLVLILLSWRLDLELCLLFTLQWCWGQGGTDLIN